MRRVPEIRVAMDVAWWERLIEQTRFCERWEYRDGAGRWRKFWRRHGGLPKGEIR